MLIALSVGRGHVAMFRTESMKVVKIFNERRVVVDLPLFVERVDSNGIMVMPRCRDRPLSFHACMRTCSALLTLVHSQPMVYEDDPDFQINPRQLVQNMADLYSVDPNDMMGHYSLVKSYLSHKNLQHPPTIEAGLTALQERAKSTTTIKRFH